jgi:hypothetical protein
VDVARVEDRQHQPCFALGLTFGEETTGAGALELEGSRGREILPAVPLTSPASQSLWLPEIWINPVASPQR